jgi:hypothetical protein
MPTETRAQATNRLTADVFGERIIAGALRWRDGWQYVHVAFDAFLQHINRFPDTFEVTAYYEVALVKRAQPNPPVPLPPNDVPGLTPPRIWTDQEVVEWIKALA